MSPVIFVIGIAMLLTAGISLIYHESPLPLVLSGLVGIGVGALVHLLTRKEPIENVSVKEGAAVAVFAWVLSCFLGALPFFLLYIGSPSLVVSFSKSFFESVSGFTTTGASIFTDVEILPKGILFWRSLMHWFGGMGIVVFAIAILPKLGVRGMHAFRMESPGPLKTDKLMPRISETEKILYTVYFFITVLEVVALLIAHVSLYDALIHTFGTVGTGGFSNYNASVAGLNNHAAEYIITFFMYLSAANFGLTYLVLWKRNIRALIQDAEFLYYSAIVTVAIGGTTVVLMYGKALAHMYSFADAFRLASFQVLTIISTTGYATTD